jgi:predicted transcriptional regulator
MLEREAVDVDGATAAAIEYGITAADQGRVVSSEEVRKLVLHWISSLNRPGTGRS